MQQLVLLVILLLTLFSSPVTMQSTTSAPDSSIVISNSLAMYILLGIAVFYSMATLICGVLAVLNCCTRRNVQMKQRVAPYVSPLPRHLTTIPEEGEASRTSSQASLLKPGTSFTNRAAVEMYEQETSMTEPAPLGEIDNKTEGRGMSFSNKTALDLEQGTVTEKELAEAEGLPGRGTTITTSFRNVVPMSKLNGSMQGSEDRPSPKPHDSPLLRHVPRGTPIAPADVKVPYSTPEASSLGKLTSTPPASPTRSSPFNKRKHPANEIPSSAKQADLSSYRRRLSSEPPSQGSQLKKTSKDRNWSTSGSPARSRPQPKNPVRGSPGQSPLSVKARARGQGTVPSIAVVSKSSGGKAEGTTSAGVKIATSKALWSELLMVKRKWYIIGTKLKLSIIRLSEIKEENQNNPDKCLTALCKELVSPSKPGSSACTWNAIVEVLRTDLVNEKELASKLEQHYCWLESPNSKTWL